MGTNMLVLGYFILIPLINGYPSLFNMDYDDDSSITDQRAGISVRRCYSWIENQQCSIDEICIHYQGKFIECVPDSLGQEFDLNQGDIMRKIGKRSGKEKKNQQHFHAKPKIWRNTAKNRQINANRQMNYNARPQHRRYWSMPYAIF